MAGLNDRMSLATEEDEDQAVTKSIAPWKEWLAATVLRRILEDAGFAFVNTFQRGEATFASTNEKLSRVETTLLLL